MADAHTHGAHPMDQVGYTEKFCALAGPVLEPVVLEAFLTLARGLPEAMPQALLWLKPPLPAGQLHAAKPDGRGIFDYGLAVVVR